MRITKVYTRTGDRGTTRLVGGKQVWKDDARIDAYGTVDELNSVLGLARALLASSSASTTDRERLDAVLAQVQDELFSVGADLATAPEDRWEGMIRVGDDEVAALEVLIDGFNDELEPLREFVLPGGGPAASALHVARTVCRRAERLVVTLDRGREPVDGVDDGCLRYLNRLSDLLFVLARWTARATGQAEVLWRKPR
jgi:cob(I)alamin adenosyltransferase